MNYNLCSSARDILLQPLIKHARIDSLIKMNDQFANLLMESYDLMKLDPNYSRLLTLFYDKGFLIQY